MNIFSVIIAETAANGPHLLEQLSWAANIILAFAAVLALLQLRLAATQLKISRNDIQLRSRRESVAIALEQCERFAHEIVPRSNEIAKEMFSRKCKFPENVDPTFPLIPIESDPASAQILKTDPDLTIKIINYLNELESFAMYFASDLADESMAFQPAAFTFCNSCEFYRFFIGSYRHPNKVKLYENLVKLYNIWKPRLKRTVLEEQAKILELEKQKLPADKKGVPLGTNFK
jgi:hypothetical protein